jgi:hypothetical protein
MSTNLLNVPQQFEAVRDTDEEIIWSGKPAFFPFLLSGLPFLIFGIFWGIIDFGFIKFFSKETAGMEDMSFFYLFFVLHSFPCWGSVLNMVRLALVYNNTYYAYTNKRLMMCSGFWGTDFKAIDYDKIADLTVNVNPVENLLGVGTISAFSGRTTSRGMRIYDRFIAISNPYEVFKRIKEIAADIKTDWNYPNALRPGTNPGYRSKYNPGGKD